MTTCVREVVLDTETTGLDPSVHRIIEIGCVELINGVPSGRTWQQYINPEQPVDYSASLIHGISDKMLADKPVFAQIADKFLDFIGGARLIIHNAGFDLGFLNADLLSCGRPVIDKSRVVDSLLMARKARPGAKADLDSLRKRFGVKAERKQHGALTDALILADVYIHLNGGRQDCLAVDVKTTVSVLDGLSPAMWTPRLVYPSEAELAAHAAFVSTIPNAMWLRS